MKKSLLLSSLTAAAATAALAPAAAVAQEIKVMSRNLYLGADLIGLGIYGSDPANLPAFKQSASGVWKTVEETSFPRRSKALARELKLQKPDVVGLQEAALWRKSQTPSGKPQTVVYDFTKTLLKDAKQQGVEYRIVKSQDEFDFTAPTAAGFSVRFTQRDVLLVRVKAKLKVSNVKAGRFTEIFSLPTPAGEANSRRGYVSAEFKTKQGKRVRVVNTHLEAYGDEIRNAQAAQLAGLIDSTQIPMVLLGDLNSDPTDASGQAAQQFLDIGMSSAFPAPVATCCQAEKLTNSASELSSWIDHILVRDTSATARGVTGNKPGDKVSGLWPSDHAGVWAKISLE